MPMTGTIQFKLYLFLAVVLSSSACTQDSRPPEESAARTEAPDFSQGLADSYITQQTGVPANKVGAETKAELFLDFERIKAAAAAEEGVAAASTRQAIELQRIELLAHAGAERAGVYSTPAEPELKAQYDQYVSGLPPKEFHVAHILVATEAMAQILITELQAGDDFAKLARDKSADDSRATGGNLGWISPGKLPAEFTGAMQKLKPGQFTERPIHTIYGWHVIKLLEARSSAAPPYDQVKAQLILDIQQQRYKEFLAAAIARTATR